MAWLLLAVAILFEVSGTLALKASDGLSKPGWLALTAVTYVVSFILLARVLSLGMPIGVAYGIWSAIGIALVAAMASVVFDERVTPLMAVGIVVLMVGVVLVELGSPH